MQSSIQHEDYSCVHLYIKLSYFVDCDANCSIDNNLDCITFQLSECHVSSFYYRDDPNNSFSVNSLLTGGAVGYL